MTSDLTQPYSEVTAIHSQGHLHGLWALKLNYEVARCERQLSCVGLLVTPQLSCPALELTPEGKTVRPICLWGGCRFLIVVLAYEPNSSSYHPAFLVSLGELEERAPMGDSMVFS